MSTNQQTSSYVGRASAKKLAKSLGWFSIGLGLAELLAPRALATISGLPKGHTGLIRLYGLREIASGITIFLNRIQLLECGRASLVMRLISPV